MVEVVLSICLAIGFLGLLTYIYFHEKEERQLRNEDLTRIQKLMGESFKDFLKHIEKLERMTLPKSVTTKDVQSVLDRMGVVADESLEIAHDNEIEKAEPGVELPDDNWTDHITGDTKIAFEGEEIPTVVEENSVSVV